MQIKVIWSDLCRCTMEGRFDRKLLFLPYYFHRSLQKWSTGADEVVVLLEFTPIIVPQDNTVLTQEQQGHQPRKQHQAQNEESKGHWPPFGRWGRDSWNNNNKNTFSNKKNSSHHHTVVLPPLWHNHFIFIYSAELLFYLLLSFYYHCPEFPGIFCLFALRNISLSTENIY